VDVIKVTPLARGWRIEGAAFPERVVVDQVNIGSAPPSEPPPELIARAKPALEPR